MQLYMIQVKNCTQFCAGHPENCSALPCSKHSCGRILSTWRHFIHECAAYLAKHGIRPHRLERHMISNGPDFETKAADVIGLYLNPSVHAAVFCVDEKTAIQALDRKDHMLPLSPGRAQSHGFEYKRNGTLSLFAALNTATGEVQYGLPSHTDIPVPRVVDGSLRVPQGMRGRRDCTGCFSGVNYVRLTDQAR